jgi:hypothetical protein
MNESFLSTDFLATTHIINDDGTTEEMGEERAATFAAALQERVEEWKTEDWQGMRERLEANTDYEIRIAHFGGHVPIQGEGTLDGKPFYFRARYTHASLSVDTTDEGFLQPTGTCVVAEDYMDAVVDNPGSYASARVTDEDDDYGAGWLNPEETEIVFLSLIPRLVKMTPEANAAIHEERSRHFQEMVEKLKAGGIDETAIVTEDPLWGQDAPE